MTMHKCCRCLRDEFTLHSKLGHVILVYPFEGEHESKAEKMYVCIPHIREISAYLNNYGFNYGKTKFRKSIPPKQTSIEVFE